MEARFERLDEERQNVHRKYIMWTLNYLDLIVKQDDCYSKSDMCLNTLVGCIFTLVKGVIGDDEEMQREFVRKVTQLFILNFNELNRMKKEKEGQVT
jgi:hypothetical protein